MGAIPWILVGLRAALAPTIVLLASYRVQGLSMALAIIAALVSDIYDGMLTRKFGVATTVLRRTDSFVDSIFYLAAA